MRRGWSPEDTLPARAQSPEIETAQMRDLVLKRRFGRGTTIARFFCIASGRLFDPVRGCRRSLAISDTIDPTLVSLL